MLHYGFRGDSLFTKNPVLLSMGNKDFINQNHGDEITNYRCDQKRNYKIYSHAEEVGSVAQNIEKWK